MGSKHPMARLSGTNKFKICAKNLPLGSRSYILFLKFTPLIGTFRSFSPPLPYVLNDLLNIIHFYSLAFSHFIIHWFWSQVNYLLTHTLLDACEFTVKQVSYYHDCFADGITHLNPSYMDWLWILVL